MVRLSGCLGLALCAVLGSLACSDSADDGANPSDAGDTGQRVDARPQTDAAIGPDAQTDAEVIRFVALGAGGRGDATQVAVASAMKSVCDARGGCDFALYLGDNILDVGASSADDAQFATQFEIPYADLDFPFYVVLGDHDYGVAGASLNLAKGQFQVDYGATSTKWMMPARFYSETFGEGASSLEIFGLDTSQIFLNDDAAQVSAVSTAIAESTANWKIAFGHHTYLSNGRHGNAGNYEGISGIPSVSGDSVKSFVDAELCNNVDVLLAGHDHNRQWLQPSCGMEIIVSGTASRTTDLEVSTGTPTHFETDQKGGFLLVEIQGSDLTGRFFNEDGVLEFERTVSN